MIIVPGSGVPSGRVVNVPENEDGVLRATDLGEGEREVPPEWRIFDQRPG